MNVVQNFVSNNLGGGSVRRRVNVSVAGVGRWRPERKQEEDARRKATITKSLIRRPFLQISIYSPHTIIMAASTEDTLANGVNGVSLHEEEDIDFSDIEQKWVPLIRRAYDASDH